MAPIETISNLLAEYGYLIVFLAAIAEALPLVGLLVPGQAVIIVAGFFAASDLLDLRVLILVAIPAGILGDALGYHLGRAYGRDFLTRYGARLKISDAHLARSDALFAKWGPFALVLARFSFLTRSVGPILAGISRMKPRVFWPYNVLGAVLWSVSYSLLGYFFGYGFFLIESRLGRILTVTGVVVVGVYLLYRLMRKYAPGFTRADYYVALAASGAGAVFGVLADRVGRLGPANPLDAARPALESFLAPAKPLFGFVAALTDFSFLGVVSLALLLLLAARRLVWEAVLVGLGVGGVILLAEGLQPIFASFQPGDYVLPSGFPSAHAAIPLVFAGVVTYLVAEWRWRTKPWLVHLTAGLGVLLAALASLAGLAEGTEQPSSTLAGLCLGIAWLCLSILVVEFGLKRARRPTAR
jgi:membrane protein DedA with SNARE-associated domain